ncbi:MAG TPA: replicative DNA helicase [Candidatus Magasanikbacteria bacterium]|nr:replicative DNA helicase [Candidatus Magasanikbacteria bacterium]
MPTEEHQQEPHNRIPPQSIETEMSVLGCILVDQNTMLAIADHLESQDFYRQAHRSIYETCLELYNKSEPIDMLTVGTRLEERGELEKIGGNAYLAELANSVTTTTHAPHYAETLHKKATLRRLLDAARSIDKLGYEEAIDLEQVLDEAHKHLFGVSERYLKQTFIPIRSILAEAFDRIDELHRERGKLRGISTGFPGLDALLAGLQKSDLVILAARPSVGKTSLALDIARHVAAKEKIPVGIFSLEMSKEQLVDRFICAEARVDLWKLRTGRLSDSPDHDDFPRIGQAMGVLSEAPLFIDDSANVSVSQIRTKARRMMSEHGLGLIVVDYLQLMESKTQIENRVLEIAAITRALKGIARELNVPVLALSQLSRAVEQSKPAIPKLAHLRDSGSIEQDADVVMFIYRKAADRNYRMEDIPPDERMIAEIHIAKHRNGPTGIVKLFFAEETASFRTLDRRHGATVGPRPSGGSQTVAATPHF